MRNATATDTLLGHCLARAFLLTGDEAPTPWKLAKVTPVASRVASFVVLWAHSLQEEGTDSLGIEEFVERGYMSRSSAYRRQAEFRSLWTEYETPDELAQLLLEAMRRARDSKLSPLLPIAL